TQIYTLSLHDALPISHRGEGPPHPDAAHSFAGPLPLADALADADADADAPADAGPRRTPHHLARGQRPRGRAQVADPLRERVGRSEEHTSELQSQSNL